jgi:hypothetical protein
MNLHRLVASVVIGASGLLAVSPAGAALISNSSPFDVGMGFQSNWNTTETATANAAANPTVVGTIQNGVPFAVGDFTVTISAVGSFFSSVGPAFDNRDLADGDATKTAGYRNQFSITATYNGGGAPIDAIAGTDQVALSIDSISIYAMKYPSLGQNPINWIETTPGHEGSGPSVALIESTALGTASQYTQVGWTTALDLVVPGTPGATITRTFTFQGGTTAAEGDQNYLPFDGFEIQGAGIFSYEIPEPASASILIVAVAGLMLRRRA